MTRRRLTITALSLLSLILGVAVLSGCAGASADPTAEAAMAEGTMADRARSTTSTESSSAKPLSDEDAAGITVDTDLVYREVDGAQLRLDVCRDEDAAPAEETLPAVLLIHGGGFRAGDKATRQWQLICRWLAHSGYVAVSVNYRLAPEHPFPAAIEDVQAAVVWTREHAEGYGIDPDRIGTMGGSAGANLAELLGSSGQGSTTEGARVASVISLSGPSDLTERGLQLGTPEDDQIRRVLDYLGCTELVGCTQAVAASPITHVDRTDPPFLLAHSQQERLPVEQTQAMADALTAVGAIPEVLIRPGTAHATRLLDQRAVRDAVLDFLDRTLG